MFRERVRDTVSPNCAGIPRRGMPAQFGEVEGAFQSGYPSKSYRAVER